MRLTVVAKTILGFVVLILMMILTNVINYNGLTNIQNSAQSVIEEKNPLQLQVSNVQNQALILGKASLRDFYLDNINALRSNKTAFQQSREGFEQSLNSLSRMSMQPAVKSNFNKAQRQIQSYLGSVDTMYQYRERYLTQVDVMSQHLETIIIAIDDTSAPLLDLAYMDGVETNDDLKSLAGAGNNVDTQLIALLNSTKELVAARNAQSSADIVDTMRFALSNISENNAFIYRLAESVDTGGLIEDYQQQFGKLEGLLFGASGMVGMQSSAIDYMVQARESLLASESSNNQAIDSFDALFKQVSQSTSEGQSEIVDIVEANMVLGWTIMILSFVIAAAVAFATAKGISVPMYRITNSLKVISSGDLTHKADARSHCEFGDLARQVNALSENLHTLVVHILEQEESLQEATDVSVELGHETLGQVDKQREQIQLTAENTESVRNKSQANLEEINRGMCKLNEVTQKTDQAMALVNRGEKQILQQAEQAEVSSTVISNLAENSRNIEGILDVIKTIAEQTNLLALNAAIEAARAGEQGRGFAVVADEVRTLANRTQNSTEEIEKMIASLQSDAQKAVSTIEQGKKLSDQSVAIINEVNSNVGEITRIIEELAQINNLIVDDTNAQDQLLQSVAQRLQTIVSLAEKSAGTTEQSNAATEEVQELMSNLRMAVSKFKV